MAQNGTHKWTLLLALLAGCAGGAIASKALQPSHAGGQREGMSLRKLELVDDSGQARASLEIDAQARVVFQMLDEKQRPRLSLVAGSDGASSVLLTAGESPRRLELSARPDGSVRVGLTDGPGDTPRVALGLSDAGSGIALLDSARETGMHAVARDGHTGIILYRKPMQRAVSITVDGDGIPVVTLNGRKGQPQAMLTAGSANGVGGLVLFDDSGQSRGGLISGAGGMSLDLLGKDGKTRAEVTVVEGGKLRLADHAGKCAFRAPGSCP